MKAARTRSCRGLALSVALALLFSASAQGVKKKDPKADQDLPGIDEKSRGMERKQGLFPVFLDRPRGQLWLELPTPDPETGLLAEVLYVEGLVQGLGSNPVGLDRGQLGETHVLRIRRLGPRVLFEVPNLRFRTLSGNAAETRAAHESFATSVLWAGTIGALDSDGRSLLEMTGFAVRDAHGVANAMKRAGQGVFALDESRSAVNLAACRAFPDNVELEAVLTYGGEDVGSEVRGTAPLPEAVTLVQHHSLVRLPDEGYKPRRFDPRIGVNGIEFLNYGAGLADPLEEKWIVRHRLERETPEDPSSPPREPIIYYVDPGAPEPIRSALVEGASWWVEAFSAAGFPDAFRVEILPPDADPLDVRFNVIQWVHRATRGWSFGGGVVDPRTGEMVKGHVSLGSLRARHDRLLFEGLAGADRTGSGGEDDPVELALARIRQLSAHEVGHTLGMAHNFAASVQGRTSVMDYPAPLIKVSPDGGLDFSEAYREGLGPWDVHCVRYAYLQPLPDQDEAALLTDLVREGLDEGFLFLSDADARPPDAADPRANLWDNGEDPVLALRDALEVRQIALSRFGEANVRAGRPLSELRHVLAPLYLHHRYQLEAAAKVVGGMETAYAVQGDKQLPIQIIDGERQREALQMTLRILSPEELDLSEEVLGVLAPPVFESESSRDDLGSRTGPAFDALGAASAAADHALGAILQPGRLARVVDFHRRDSSLPSLDIVLETVRQQVFDERPESDRRTEIRQTVQWALVWRLAGLAGDPSVPMEVRSRVESVLRRVVSELETPEPGASPYGVAHRLAMEGYIKRFLGRSNVQGELPPIRPLPVPPGSPIGVGWSSDCGGW